MIKMKRKSLCSKLQRSIPTILPLGHITMHIITCFMTRLWQNILLEWCVLVYIMNDKWDMRFLLMAAHAASWSLDPSTQTGAVIVDNNRRIISQGYNGLPQGVEDTHERLHNRELKYSMIVHAERNALIFAERSLRECTLYTWPFMSCSVCAAMVIQAGITRVVAPFSDNPRWVDSFELSRQMFEEAGVEIDLIDPKDIPTITLNPPSILDAAYTPVSDDSYFNTEKLSTWQKIRRKWDCFGA
jgi:dCMP deaminase